MPCTLTFSKKSPMKHVPAFDLHLLGEAEAHAPAVPEDDPDVQRLPAGDQVAHVEGNRKAADNEEGAERSENVVGEGDVGATAEAELG